MSTQHDSNAALRQALVIAAGVIGSAVFIVMPVLLGALADRLLLSDRVLGEIASAQMFGMLAASLISAWILPRIGPRDLALVGTIGLTVAHAASGYIHSAAGLILAQGAGGLFGGFLMAVSLAYVSTTPASERLFAYWISAQIALGAIGSFVLPSLTAKVGTTGVFLIFAGFAISTGPMVAALPRTSLPTPANQASARANHSRTAKTAALLATFLFGVGLMTVWPFLDRMGRSKNLDASSVASVISISLLAALVGALLAGVVAGRWSPKRTITTSVGAMILCMPALSSAASLIMFAAAVIAFAALWNFSVPAQLELTSSVGTEATFVVLYIAALKGGYVVAPLLVGLLLTDQGYAPVYWLASSALLASICGYILAGRPGKLL